MGGAPRPNFISRRGRRAAEAAPIAEPARILISGGLCVWALEGSLRRGGLAVARKVVEVLPTTGPA